MKMYHLQQAFNAHLRKSKLVSESDHIILAVSGGIDSAVMAALFHQAGFRFSIAHCNFGLRGKDAMADEAFVKQLAEKYHADCYIKRFKTRVYAKRNKVSIQMAARELRYTWFRELVKQKKGTRVALAHQKDDVTETFLINIIRGTGIAGLHGIRDINEDFIRPLLFASRDDIETYAAEKGITFKEDASNNDDKYTRNKIRHQILPALKEINPAILDTISDTINHLAETEILYNHYIEKLKSELLIKKGKSFYISILKLCEAEGTPTLLFELIKNFGFNSTQTQDIYSIIGNPSGKLFLSPTHKLLNDRQRLIISPITTQNNEVYTIEKQNCSLENEYFKIQFSLLSGKDINPKTSNKNCIYLNAQSLQFPLTLRKWQQGDAFMPLGMKKMKKISDFLIDNKINIFEKENILVLVSSGKIAAVIGHRPDERFKVNKDSSNVIKIDYVFKA